MPKQGQTHSLPFVCSFTCAGFSPCVITSLIITNPSPFKCYFRDGFRSCCSSRSVLNPRRPLAAPIQRPAVIFMMPHNISLQCVLKRGWKKKEERSEVKKSLTAGALRLFKVTFNWNSNWFNRNWRGCRMALGWMSDAASVRPHDERMWQRKCARPFSLSLLWFIWFLRTRTWARAHAHTHAPLLQSLPQENSRTKWEGAASFGYSFANIGTKWTNLIRRFPRPIL